MSSRPSREVTPRKRVGMGGGDAPLKQSGRKRVPCVVSIVLCRFALHHTRCMGCGEYQKAKLPLVAIADTAAVSTPISRDFLDNKQGLGMHNNSIWEISFSPRLFKIEGMHTVRIQEITIVTPSI